MSYYTFESIGKVEFYDCDPMMVVWHGNYLKYLEIARGNFLDMINLGYNRIHEIGYAFPIVELKLKYTNSLRVGDNFKIITELNEYQNRLVHNFKIVCNNKICLKAMSVQVAFNTLKNEMEFIMPQEFRDKVEFFMQKQGIINETLL